jgi:hypothetical protein
MLRSVSVRNRTQPRDSICAVAAEHRVPAATLLDVKLCEPGFDRGERPVLPARGQIRLTLGRAGMRQLLLDPNTTWDG